jgi:ADP-ribosyl-[dinitrogen reductase] hydrolase
MIGAIIGEMIGRSYKIQQQSPENFSLPLSQNSFSEDTFLSIALAAAIANNHEYTKLVSTWRERHQKDDFGLSLKNIPDNITLPAKKSKIYGTAAHAYLIGYACYRLDDVMEQSAQIAAVSHEHYANSHVAQAVASAVFLANSRFSKRYIKAYFEDQYGFDLSVPYPELREGYSHIENPMVSVYRALISLLQSADFDDAIRISLSIGDAKHKQAFICGAFAEAYYQDYPDLALSQIMNSLPEEMRHVIITFNRRFRVKAKEKFYENMV